MVCSVKQIITKNYKYFMYWPGSPTGAVALTFSVVSDIANLMACQVFFVRRFTGSHALTVIFCYIMHT